MHDRRVMFYNSGARHADLQGKYMAGKKRGLGRGLDALISETPADPAAVDHSDSEKIQMIRLTDIEPDPKQPRHRFDQEKLEELAQSIKEKGLLEPILLQECMNPHHYEIIAGERRWRASRIAGLKEIPAVVRNYGDQERVEISLIENIQREDLNPIEEARAYQRLSEEFHLKQEEIAQKVSKNRTSVANSMRLLKLPESVQDMVADGQLSMGQARALISLGDEETQLQIANRIVEQNLSVREVEKLIRKLSKSGGDDSGEEAAEELTFTDSQTAQAEARQQEVLEKTYQDIAGRLQQSLGMKVEIHRRGKAGGKVEISFSDGEDLEQIMDRLMRPQAAGS